MQRDDRPCKYEETFLHGGWLYCDYYVNDSPQLFAYSDVM